MARPQQHVRDGACCSAVSGVAPESSTEMHTESLLVSAAEDEDEDVGVVEAVMAVVVSVVSGTTCVGSIWST